MRGYYPKIIVPSKYEFVLDLHPHDNISRPIEPVKPVRPEIPKEPTSDGCTTAAIWGFLFFILFAFWFLEGGAIILYFAIAFAVGLLWVRYKFISLDEEEYEKKKASYPRDLQLFEQEFLDYLVIKLPIYQIELSNYNNLNTTEEIIKYRKERLRELSGRSITEPIMITQKGGKEGFVEPQFRLMLKNALKGELILDHKLWSEDGELFPDILVKHPELPIYIDIEIDEPYVADSGEPIHWELLDATRDKIVSRHGWFVLRFAEEQIARQPMECIDLINELLSTVDKMGSVSFGRYLVDEVKCWTKQQAHAMASEDYRNTYLSRYGGIRVSPILGVLGESAKEVVNDWKRSKDYEIEDDLPF